MAEQCTKAKGNMRMAATTFGHAAAYEEILIEADIFLNEENEHYVEMVDTYVEAILTKPAKGCQGITGLIV